MSSEYSIYSPFDPDKHKDTYKNYLEVLLLEDGSVVLPYRPTRRRLWHLPVNVLELPGN